MINPGTSVSLKGRQPLAIDSREVQYLYAILQAINNLAAVTSNSGTSQIQTTATGDTSVVLPAGVWLQSIAMKSTGASETIKIGTTLGSSDIANNVAVTNTGYSSTPVNIYYPTSQTIYFTGAVGSVNYQLLISK